MRYFVSISGGCIKFFTGVGRSGARGHLKKSRESAPARLTATQPEHGMASIVAVCVMMVLVTLVSLGFARIMDRAAVNSQLHQASSTATYAAQSALNDISTYIKTNPTAYSRNCVGSNSLIGSATSPGPFYNDANLGGSTDRNVQYTCLLLNQTPADLVYQALPSGGSRVVKATTSAFPGSLDKMMISWQPTNGQITGFPPAGSKLFDESTWSSLSNNYVPMLRVTLYPVSDTNSLASVQANSKTVFLYPQAASGNVPAPNYASLVDGSILPVPCTTSVAAGDFNGTADYTCNIIIGNLATTTQPDAISYFYLRLTPIYGQADIKIKANDMWGQSVNFVGVQAIADATAKVGGVAKRLQARLDIGGVGQNFDGNISPYSAAVPEYSVRTADALCKRFQHYTPDSTNYFYDFVSLDAGTQDSVCHTGLVTKAPALTLSITGANGQDSGLTVDSQANNPDSPQNPVQKGTVYVDSAARVNWQSTDAAYNCNASGGWSGNKNNPPTTWSGVTGTGSQNFSGVSDVTNYTLTCSGPGGTTSPKTVTLWPPPQITGFNGPSSNHAGDSYTISWSSKNTSRCDMSGDWTASNIGTSGSHQVGTAWNDHSTKYFTLTCYDPAGRSTSQPLNGGNGVTQVAPDCAVSVSFTGSTTSDARLFWSTNCPRSDPPNEGVADRYITTNVPGYAGSASTWWNGDSPGGGVALTTAGTYNFRIVVWAPGWGDQNSPIADSGTKILTVRFPIKVTFFDAQGPYNNPNVDQRFCPDGDHHWIDCVRWATQSPDSSQVSCQVVFYGPNGSSNSGWLPANWGWSVGSKYELDLAPATFNITCNGPGGSQATDSRALCYKTSDYASGCSDANR